MEDLEWLGFKESGSYVTYQSERNALYEGCLEKLRTENLTYFCKCSRRELESQEGDIYSGRCRDLNLTGVNLNERIKFGDSKLEDVVLRNRDKHWSYHFSSVVDDNAAGVNLIVRGEDLLESTLLQKELHKLLGNHTRIIYVHHPLIKDELGNKLSKRFFADSIKKF